MPAIRTLLLLLLVAALAGCTTTSPHGQGPGTPGASPSARAGFGGPSPAIEQTDEAMFRTPSGNIFCALTATTVRCDIAKRSWTAPAKPASCPLDWGHGLYIDADGAGLLCAGDSLLNSSTRTLAYDTGLRSGALVCTSESTGLKCVNERTTHGFTLAVAEYTLF
jgi:hypothetical protein